MMRPRPTTIGRSRLFRAVPGWRGVAVTVAAVALVAGGCTQNSGTTNHSPSASPRPSGSGSSGAQPPTGTQLGSLLTHAKLPAGWGPVQGGAIPEDDSGAYVHSPLGPQGQAHGCSIVSSGMTASYFTNWWSVSYAGYVIENTGASNPSNTDIMTLTIAAYRPLSDAAQTLSMASSLAGTCKSFKDSSGNPVTVSSATVSGIGSQNLYLRSTTNVAGAGISFTQLLLAQVGSYLIGVDTGTADSAAISQATIDSMGTWLVSLANSA
jgi:hypothetical protein